MSPCGHGRAVSDAALTTRVNVLRNTLHDDGRAQRLIGFVRRKGFRFIGEVRVEGWPASLPALTSNGAQSIAVLPFANLSGDPAQDFLATSSPTKCSPNWRGCAGCWSSRAIRFTYKGSAVDIRKIGSQLGVAMCWRAVHATATPCSRQLPADRCEHRAAGLVEPVRSQCLRCASGTGRNR